MTVSRNLQWIAVIFYIYFRQILCFLLCINVKVYDTLLKNIVKYRDFFNRQIRASNLPTKYCKFYTLLYFLTLNLYFFFFFLQDTVFCLPKNCKTSKIQLLVKIFTIYC